MPFILRASLGAEFEDRTSPRLLAQPEPQYLYAMLWKMAVMSQDLRDVFRQYGLGWRDPSIGNMGAAYPQPVGLRAMLDFWDPMYSDTFVNVTELAEPGKGHTIRLNRPTFANTTYTQSSREVAAGTQISTTPINIQSEQVSLTTKRWGGPYDQTNGNVAPFGVDRFDVNKAIHSTVEMVGGQLQRDFDRTIDTFIGAYLDLGANTIYAGGYAADTSFYGGASSGGINANGYGEAPLTFNLINQIEKKADDLNLPTFPDGCRAFVVPPLGILELKDDPNWLKMVEFHPPVNPILSQSYWRTFGRTHIFKSTTLPTTTNGNAGMTVSHGHYFVPGVLGSGVSEPPNVRRSSADNYGEWALVIWLAYMAFGLLDNRFVVDCHFN